MKKKDAVILNEQDVIIASDDTTSDAALDKAMNKKDEDPRGAYTHVLRKPIVFEDKEYTEFTFEWSKLTGADALAIEHELIQLGRPFVTPEFSTDYLIRMAAKACTLPIGIDLLEALPISEFNKIRGKARSFLMLSA